MKKIILSLLCITITAATNAMQRIDYPKKTISHNVMVEKITKGIAIIKKNPELYQLVIKEYCNHARKMDRELNYILNTQNAENDVDPKKLLEAQKIMRTIDSTIIHFLAYNEPAASVTELRASEQYAELLAEFGLILFLNFPQSND